jgi:hypothetical protein
MVIPEGCFSARWENFVSSARQACFAFGQLLKHRRVRLFVLYLFISLPPTVSMLVTFADFLWKPLPRCKNCPPLPPHAKGA